MFDIDVLWGLQIHVHVIFISKYTSYIFEGWLFNNLKIDYEILIQVQKM